MIWYPDGDDVAKLHDNLVEFFATGPDPIFPPGVKDRNLLESACMRPQTGLGTIDKYPTIEQKAAALLHSLIKNHAFHNGNKRTALVAAMTFLWRNDHRLTVAVTDDEVFDLMVGIANNAFPSPRHGLSADDLILEVAWWLRQRITVLTAKTAAMRVNDFLSACEAAGVTWKKSGTSFVVRNGKKSIRINRSTRKLDGPVVRQYLRTLGLIDVRVDEFQEGLSPEQAVVRSFRNVLRRLAHA